MESTENTCLILVQTESRDAKRSSVEGHAHPCRSCLLEGRAAGARARVFGFPPGWLALTSEHEKIHSSSCATSSKRVKNEPGDESLMRDPEVLCPGPSQLLPKSAEFYQLIQ